MLASLNRRAENIIVEPVVIAELKLRDVQRQVFRADFVECADDAAFHQRPETLNRIRVNCADNILFGYVPDGLAIVFRKSVKDFAFIGSKKTDFIGNHLAHELLCGFLGDTADRANDNIPLTAYRADEWRLAGTCTARFAVVFLVPMTVCVFATNPSFIDLDNPAKFDFRLNKSRADFVAHQPSGFDGAEAHVAPDLPRTNSLFAGEHQVNDFEPVTERLVRVLENGASDDGETIAVVGTHLALPVIAGCERIDLVVVTAGAFDTIRPAPSLQVGPASTLIADWKHRVELSRCKLVNWLRTLCHDGSPLRSMEIA